MAKIKFIVFTKHFKELDIDLLIEKINDMDVEGVDLCVRPGYPVNLDNIEKYLPIVVKKFKENGLSIPMITTPTDFVEPKDPVVEKVFYACQMSGIKLIKIGYWFMGKDGYWKTVENIRGKIENFIKYAEKYQIKFLIHNHSGATMGLNSCSVMNLVKGFPKEYIGIFLDPGHLSIVGEPIDMAIDIVKEYISAVAVKDLIRERIVQEGKRKWQIRVVPLGEGYVEWDKTFNKLFEINFSGPISIHSEYPELKIDDLIDQTKIDIRYLKRVIESLKKDKNESN
ncbi:MAG: sugar phosphate isomerase/epimerase [Candidatus Omnitrophica bacterium]|nr:sugar phosphate isomerase/epimerase [Candidatus Omnitrophota bacterium]MCM8803105.1 sugar phosphate isomerase/epimerase [Candidatus Omnitrophota bacterium]